MRVLAVIFSMLLVALSSCSRADEQWNPTLSVERPEHRYCVISLVDSADPYSVAVTKLTGLHRGIVLNTDPDGISSLLPELRKEKPEFVAIVVRPESLDVNFVGAVMKLATEVDDDPFLDFSYGFITGETPESAVALIDAGQLSDFNFKPGVTMVGVGGSNQLATSTSSTQQMPIRGGYLKQTAHMIANKSDAGQRDEAFIKSIMPMLDRNPIIVFAGHGYPREVVGGPTYEHLKYRDFRGAVALNIACYTGVTGTWYEDDWSSMTVKKRKVPASKSFCLNMLNTGVAGYVAYACARPAGPTMLGDALLVATAGDSLGELRRKDGNSVVLSHLQHGHDSLQIRESVADAKLDRNRNTQDFLLAMSTGGLLLGDPVCKPFAERRDSDPRAVAVRQTGNTLEARVEVAGPLWHFFCADQITMWDDQTQSFRIETSIPLGEQHVADVQLKESSFGVDDHQLVAVVEEHNGKRRLHIKASFKQPPMQELLKLSRTGVSGVFEVSLSDQPGADVVIRHGERG